MTTLTRQAPDAAPTPQPRGIPDRPAHPVPAPPKARRRWGLFAAMAALVGLGAVGNAWLVQATSGTHEVLAARTLIERGSLVTSEQLVNVQVNTDPALRTVPATDAGSLLGQRAVVDIAAGALLTPDSVGETTIPAAGYSLVGVAASPARMPGAALRAGDRVRVVAGGQPGATGQGAAAHEVVAAEVVSTRAGSEAPGQAGETIVTVQVPTQDATRLAALAATGTAVIVLDSRER